ncbi:MAG: outer membrane protein insertion porin family [Myxococcota bacterium]|jgi:outer membrane protein insertion porin family
MSKIITFLFTALLLFSTSSFAAQKFKIVNENNQIIKSTVNKIIVIEGNQRIDSQTIKSYLEIAGLRKNSPEAINQSIKNLFASELFIEAEIYSTANQMIIKVKENPIISEIEFRGNKKIDDESLQGEIKLEKRGIYTKAKLQSDIKRINDIYIKSGRFLTKIEPKIVAKDQNRIDLIFDINEGKKASIRDISFIGNDVFSDSELASEITTKKSKWWKFMSSSDSYDSDRIEFDKEKLRRFYSSKGYADFNALSAIAQITPTKDRFFINFLLEEGIKYEFGETTIANKIRKFDEIILEKSIKTKTGKVYNGNLVDETVDKMVDIMSEKGYAFAHIEPILKRNKDEKIIDIEYVIEETPRIYINKITISGNTRTMDEVIRREIRVLEGDAYNITKINRSKQRIQNLGFFDKVEFDTKKVGDANLVDLEIEIKEKKTGELNFGIGYSTVDKATGNIGLKERNLFGTGRELGVNFQKSSLRFSNEVNYTKPWFMGREISVGVDLFNYQLNKQNTLVYDQKSNGGLLRANYSILEHLGHQLRYSLKSENISNIDSSASISIQNLEGEYVNSSVGHTLLYDKRDNRIDPREGYYFNLSQDYAGLGGDIKYVKNEGSAGYYLPILGNKDFVLKFSAKFGHIDGLGQDIRSNDNFFLGGNNFRGFEYAGIGPRAEVNGSFKDGDALGGKTYIVSTTEFRFPLGLPKDLGISGSVFSDIGTLKGVDSINKNNSAVSDTGSIRSSYGLSFGWASPIGPIRLDFSKANKKEEFDRVENFRFSFGSNF